MTSRHRLLSSVISTKLIIGATGILLFLYLIVHIAGNLMVFLGQDTFNRYSYMLVSNPLVAPVEIGLLLVVLIHLFKAISMTVQNRAARPRPYAVKKMAGGTSQKSLASSTMILTGLALLVFIPIHVAMFKYGPEYAYGANGIRDLYRLEVENFSSPVAVALYVLAMVVVGFHLWHGISSSAQTLGADTPTITPRIRVFGWVMAIVIGGGFLTIPLWLFFFGGRS